jgi:hypothetical protein
MAYADGDVLRITMFGYTQYNSSPLNNVFHYVVSELTGSFTNIEDQVQLAGDFLATVQPTFAEVQSIGAIISSVEVRNMTNLVDVATYIPTGLVNGDLPVNAEPSQVALSFKLNRTTALTRNGSKRVGGIGVGVVTDTSGENLIDDPRITAIELMLAATIEIVTGLDSCVLIPVIARRPATGLPITITNRVASSSYRGAGSQNTRKRLLGAT